MDIEHLAEEVEDLRKTERRAVRSQLRLILSHLLQWVYQPDKRTDSWRSTIANGRVLVQENLEDNASLARELPELFAWAYPRARRDAAKDIGLALATFPEVCPWTLEQCFDEDFWPEGGSRCRESSLSENPSIRPARCQMLLAPDQKTATLPCP